MGLLLYETTDPNAAFSIDNDFSKPIAHTFNGSRGAVLTKRYFVRNDDSSFMYSNIKVFPVFISGDNIIAGGNGFSWKLTVGDQEPLEEQWALVSPGNEIDIPDIGTVLIGDVSTFEPFWIRIEVPKGASVKSHEGIKLRVAATETAI
jgi:hypothetical protein